MGSPEEVRRYLMPFHIVRELPSSTCCTTGSEIRYSETELKHSNRTHKIQQYRYGYHVLIPTDRLKLCILCMGLTRIQSTLITSLMEIQCPSEEVGCGTFACCLF